MALQGSLAVVGLLCLLVGYLLPDEVGLASVCVRAVYVCELPVATMLGVLASLSVKVKGFLLANHCFHFIDAIVSFLYEMLIWVIISFKVDIIIDRLVML